MTADSRRHCIHGETVIDADPAAVWEVLSDFHRVDSWAPVITRVVDIGPTSRGVGAARRCQLRRLGVVDEVVVVWEEGRRLHYRVSPLGPIGDSQSSWEIDRVGERSARVELRFEYDMRFGPLGLLLETVAVRRLLTRNLPGALAALKRCVETRWTVSGGASDPLVRRRPRRYFPEESGDRDRARGSNRNAFGSGSSSST